jgi:hypothetical protein
MGAARWTVAARALRRERAGVARGAEIRPGDRVRLQRDRPGADRLAGATGTSLRAVKDDQTGEVLLYRVAWDGFGRALSTTCYPDDIAPLP